MQKGDIITAVDVKEDEAGTIVRTDNGKLLGIISAKGVSAGTQIQVGPVCGNWCRLFLMGDSYQAQILSDQEQAQSS